MKLPYDVKLDADGKTFLRRERSKTGGTEFHKTYGGKMAENLALAKDPLALVPELHDERVRLAIRRDRFHSVFDRDFQAILATILLERLAIDTTAKPAA